MKAVGNPVGKVHDRQRGVLAIHEFVAGLRPRTWCCADDWIADRPQEEVFRDADLLQDAVLARSQHNFEREYRNLKELVARSGDVPGVAEAVAAVAVRYRSRGMTARSGELLSGLTVHPNAPVGVLVALAEQRRADGNEAEAIAPLERAVERAPQQLPLHRLLVELLESAEEYERAEPHLRRLLEADPDDAYLRLDLAHALHRQGKSDDARAEVTRVREMRDLEDRAAVWRYLQRRGLGTYTDQPAPP